MKVYVVFTKGIAEHWWSRFTHPEFRHCYLLTPVYWEGFSHTLKADARVNYFIQQLHLYSLDKVLANDPEITHVVEVNLAKEIRKRYIIDIRSCVTLIKLSLNETWLGVQTPKALWEKLIKQPNTKIVR